MARKYTSKDTKLLIKKHKDNIDKLESASSLPAKFGNRINSCVNDLLSRDTFAQTVMESIRGKESVEVKNLGELIKLLYLYKQAVWQSSASAYILRNNKERILNEIKDLSTGSNALSWIFSSSEKKHDFEETYEKLKNEIEGSYYWSSSQDVISSISSNDVVTADEYLNDFFANIDEYKGILKKNLPVNPRLFSPVGELGDLVRKFDVISDNLAKETAKTEAIKKEIKNAADRMIMVAVLDILKTVPVEEINRDKKGFRVKALRDSGFSTMADVYSASFSQLASVYGVSEDAA